MKNGAGVPTLLVGIWFRLRFLAVSVKIGDLSVSPIARLIIPNRVEEGPKSPAPAPPPVLLSISPSYRTLFPAASFTEPH